MFCQFQGVTGHVGKPVHRFLLVVVAEDQELIAQLFFPGPDPLGQDLPRLLVSIRSYINLL
jgi:hypothetical protein